MVLVLAGGGLGPGYQGKLLDEALSRADKVYVETYTVPGSEWLIEYAKSIARDRVVAADRSHLEEGVETIIEEASERNIVVLVPGDPLIATTHRSIVALAARKGVEYRVIPGVSGVCSSITRSLLDFYKFGRTITIPGPWRRVKAFSILDYLYSNACIGLHTLALLDITPEGRQLSPSDAVNVLMGLEEEAGISLLGRVSIIVVERAGLSGERVTVYRVLEDLSNGISSWREPASLVIPGNVSPIEAEHVRDVYGVEINGIGIEDACRARKILEDFLYNS